MKWIPLLFLLACSTQKVVEEMPSEGERISTESDAKPVSPYTVKPCYCMKIFHPVCANGQNFGNSCEAECHGHKTWKEGHCSDKKK